MICSWLRNSVRSFAECLEHSCSVKCSVKDGVQDEKDGFEFVGSVKILSFEDMLRIYELEDSPVQVC